MRRRLSERHVGGLMGGWLEVASAAGCSTWLSCPELGKGDSDGLLERAGLSLLKDANSA